MPIHKMTLEDGIFFSKQVGYIDNVDIRMWANALTNYANSSDRPIMALVDLIEVERLCPSILKVLGKVLLTADLFGVVMVVSDQMASRNASVLGKLSELDNVRIFDNLEEAQRFVKAQLNPTFGMYHKQAASVMRMVAAAI
ncbi:MAG: hypothetical protein OHK0046_35250 [Anaerolineae bacterium]